MGNYGRGWEDGYCSTAGEGMSHTEDLKGIIENRRCPPFVDCSFEQYIAAGYTLFSEEEFYKKRKEARARR